MGPSIYVSFQKRLHIIAEKIHLTLFGYVCNGFSRRLGEFRRPLAGVELFYAIDSPNIVNKCLHN